MCYTPYVRVRVIRERVLYMALHYTVVYVLYRRACVLYSVRECTCAIRACMYAMRYTGEYVRNTLYERACGMCGGPTPYVCKCCEVELGHHRSKV